MAYLILIMFIFFTTFFTPIKGQSCFGFDTYEKLIATEFNSPSGREVLNHGNPEAPTKECINLCKNKRECLSFTLDFEKKMCYSYNVNSLGIRNSLSTSPTSIFFEKICFPETDFSSSFDCPKWWAFEVERNAFLVGHVDKELTKVMSRYECEKLCLKEEMFVCRSADFDERNSVCRLSKENRKTQPDDFLQHQSGSQRFYIENQCVIVAPTSCRFQSQEGVAFISNDVLKFAENADECRNFCEEETSFNCQSYSYNNNKCSLSSDSTTTLGSLALKEEIGTMFGEKKCVVDNCNNGVMTFEKMTAYTLSSSHETFIPIRKVGSTWLQGITMDCLKHCKDSTDDCPAFVVNYQSQRCSKLDRNSQGRIVNLNPRPGGNYFEKICLRGPEAVACQNKGWAFERVIGYELDESLYNRHVPNVQNRSECEELCLRERLFVCRSAFYHEDNLDCKLSRDDRRTQKQRFNNNNNIRTSYLENACIPVLTSCPYEQTLEHYPTYTDIVHQGSITSHHDCLKLCDANQDFNCRSYAYYSAQGQCFLSGDDTVSIGGHKLGLQPRQGIAYFERNCSFGVEIPEVITTAPPTPPTTTGIVSPTLPSEEPLFENLNRTATTDKLLKLEIPCGIGQRTSFERINGHEIIGGSFPIFLYRSNFQAAGITLECLRKCELTSDCDSFVLDYQRYECYMLKKNGPIYMRSNNGKSLFNAMCMAAIVPCTKQWAIDTYLDRELRVSRPTDVILQVTRDQCARRCLEERRFQCRSANYYNFRRECTLTTEDRNSLVADLSFAAGVDYIENQCIADTSMCPYQSPELGIYMWQIDRSIYGVITAQQCEQECDRERAFNCRSFSHVDGTGEFRCLLSSGNRETLPSYAFELRQRSLYTQKDCRSQMTRSVTHDIPFPPTSSIFTPPTPTIRPVCSFDRFTYDKIIGFDPRLLRRDRIPTRDTVGILAQCERDCQELGERCKGFVVLYTPIQSCHLLEVAASEVPNTLVATPLAVYFEKVCLREPTCGKFWTFERVIGYEYEGTAIMDIPNTIQRTECEDLCLRNKACRSSNYYYKLRMCRLFADTRRNQPAAFRQSEEVDYLENQCVVEPPTCQYKDYPDRFLPFIDRLLRAQTVHECQNHCDLERRFTCRSINYEVVTRHCALSSEDLVTFSDSRDLLQFRRQSIYSEKGNCEQVSVKCNQQDMMLTINFATHFNGRVYAKGNPAECYMLGTGQQTLQFAISMGIRCGTKLEGNDLYTNEVVIQQHPVIMTDNDKTIRVMCSFEARERTYTLGNPLEADRPAVEVATLFQHPIKSVVTNTVPPPNVVMRVLDQLGQDARRVGLGDELTLRIELREINSVFALHAKNLYARSINGESLFLIDERGCPNDPSIFPNLQLDQRDGKSLYANFKAFRFPSTGMVNFEVQIKFCQDRCEPVLCPLSGISHGRRRRRETLSSEMDIIYNKNVLSLSFTQELPKRETVSENLTTETPNTTNNFLLLNDSTAENASKNSTEEIRSSKLRIYQTYSNNTFPHAAVREETELNRNLTSSANQNLNRSSYHKDYSDSRIRNNNGGHRRFQPLPPRELSPQEVSSLNLRTSSNLRDPPHQESYIRPPHISYPKYSEQHSNSPSSSYNNIQRNFHSRPHGDHHSHQQHHPHHFNPYQHNSHLSNHQSANWYSDSQDSQNNRIPSGLSVDNSRHTHLQFDQMHPNNFPDNQRHSNPYYNRMHPGTSSDKQIHSSSSQDNRQYPNSYVDNQRHSDPSYNRKHPDLSLDKQMHPTSSQGNQRYPGPYGDTQRHSNPSYSRHHPNSYIDNQRHSIPPYNRMNPGLFHESRLPNAPIGNGMHHTHPNYNNFPYSHHEDNRKYPVVPNQLHLSEGVQIQSSESNGSRSSFINKNNIDNSSMNNKTNHGIGLFGNKSIHSIFPKDNNTYPLLKDNPMNHDPNKGIRMRKPSGHNQTYPTSSHSHFLPESHQTYQHQLHPPHQGSNYKPPSFWFNSSKNLEPSSVHIHPPLPHHNSTSLPNLLPPSAQNPSNSKSFHIPHSDNSKFHAHPPNPKLSQAFPPNYFSKTNISDFKRTLEFPPFSSISSSIPLSPFSTHFHSTETQQRTKSQSLSPFSVPSENHQFRNQSQQSHRNYNFTIYSSPLDLNFYNSAKKNEQRHFSSHRTEEKDQKAVEPSKRSGNNANHNGFPPHTSNRKEYPNKEYNRWVPENYNNRWTTRPRPVPLDQTISSNDGRQNKLPEELPLSLAIVVGEDQPTTADRAPWTLERRTRPPPTAEADLSEDDTICTSKTTVVATITTVTVLYIGAAVAAVFSYRWRRNRKRKQKRYVDSQPRPQPANTDVTYGSPEVTFRNIYGGFPNEC